MSRTILTLKNQIVVAQAAGGGANVILNLANKTVQVLAAMNGQKGYSALQDYWKATAGLPFYPEPFYPVDDTAEKYFMGFDGTTYSGWKFLDDSSRKNWCGVGWQEYNADASIAQVWFGVITPAGKVGDADQPYVQLSPTDAPTDLSNTGPVNEPVKVYGDATHGAFDKRGTFRLYVRPQGKTFDYSDLTSVQRAASGPFVQAFGLSSAVDPQIKLADAVFTAAPYTSAPVTYYAATQTVSIDGTTLHYNIGIDNSTAALSVSQLYQYGQFLNRQATNINSGASPNNAAVIGKTAPVLATSFDGSTLVLAQGVYAQVNPADLNNVKYADLNTGATVAHTFTASAEMQIDATIAATADTATPYFLVLAAGYGTNAAQLVKDSTGADITGFLGNGKALVDFTIAYDAFAQGGHTPGQDIPAYFVIPLPGVKFSVTPVTIKRAAGQAFPVRSNIDPCYTAS